MPRLKNRRHERFAREYVRNGFNGAAAARSVGISNASARQIASEWLTKPNILDRVNELNEDFLNDSAMSVEEAAMLLAEIARFNPKNLYDENGQLLPIHELDAETAASIQEFEIDQVRGVAKVKAGKDRKSALMDILKHYNWHEEHNRSARSDIHIYMDEKDAQA